LFLHSLKLTYLNELSCFELAESLPSWLSIRELTLASIPKGQPRFDPSERRYRNCRSGMWDSFRKNSSLYSVTITDTNGLHKGHLIRIKAYCQRNRFFDKQWSDSKWLASDKGELGPNPPNTTNRMGPALLGSALQVPKTNVSRLLGYLSKAETKLT
jgi:hypothetical protein